ncbi:ubiquitin carboxyl-terminal hydrolase 18 [Lycium ferocissimum]|uniref:ubiquitin carboxyl-terminal hydrolase 18 n=1 Tax=Lycium ferocissimum TaxID=112874 RepID=UPI0028160E6F|nr:ubiquitin carboxyl-terminal hydrolase 18 [Lycium ferocissimum]
MDIPSPAVGCAVCGKVTSKQCSRCKKVKYCSEACQRSHWNSGHKSICRDFRSSVKGSSEQSVSTLQRRKSFAISLVPSSGKTKILNQPKKVLFPYEEFLEFFYWDNPGFPPCGLINSGNSCFANVVLQCLTHTKPLVAYLLEKGHRRECRLNGWCFLCEFQLHVERASQGRQPFLAVSRLSRLPNIGGNLTCGKQEDAHEFMRFAIDTMQLVSLDEFGGEKAVPPSTQETTLIQHIFGGHLQSQVICTKCNNLSNQLENMMDLTVEIHGDAESLEECLDQFTAEECMDGENMYKCDRCNDYVKAWKWLMIRKAPNILTIALKRFQRGRFGKLNKMVTFPETLDLCPYMIEAGDGNDIFKLYAVIVHVDVWNASYFGHYICYIKDFSGNWYRFDDSKVVNVDIDEVLSQRAYLLLYSRISARPTSLYPLESLNKEDRDIVKAEVKKHSPLQPVDCHNTMVSPAICVDSGSLPTENNSEIKVVRAKEGLSSITNSEGGKEDQDMVESGASRFVLQEVQDVGVSSAEIQKPEGRVLISDIEEKTETCEGTSNEPLLESLSEDSVDTNDEMQYDASASPSASSSSEISEDMEVDNSTLLLEKANSEKEFSSQGIHDVIQKTDGCTPPGKKLKPLLTPGFLGKCPRDECARKEVTGEVCQNSTLSGPTNACAEMGLSCESRDAAGNEHKSEEESSPSSNAVNEHTETTLGKI